MPMERRERQNLDRESRPDTNLRIRYHQTFERKLDGFSRIRLLAQDKEVKFNNLFSHFNVENLRQAFRSIDGSKAVGIDGIRKKDYEKNLEQNLEDLVTRLHKGTYRPSNKRETLIPKSNGRMRPIAIGCFEDKMVEWVLGKILTSVYEPIFIRNSFGFRPNKSAHQAIEANYYILKDNKRPFVVEIDLANFFNTVPHRKLMGIVGRRIVDKRIHSIITRFLNVGILKSTGEIQETNVGTPQGSIVSPILANIYLHQALDEWFLENYASNDSVVVRYADDAVFMFSKEERAKDFLTSLRTRLTQYGLSLNEDKTRIIDFTKGKNNIFHFLGFTFYWAMRKQGRDRLPLIIKTHKEKFMKKVQEFVDWIKTNRSRLKLAKIVELTKSKLQGHFNYYGFYCNWPKLNQFRYKVIHNLFKWLNRRSQRKSMTWEKFKRKIIPLIPKPPTMSKLKQLGWSPYVK
jgi:RNA-directed DNA polymerase